MLLIQEKPLSKSTETDVELPHPNRDPFQFRDATFTNKNNDMFIVCNATADRVNKELIFLYTSGGGIRVISMERGTEFLLTNRDKLEFWDSVTGSTLIYRFEKVKVELKRQLEEHIAWWEKHK